MPDRFSLCRRSFGTNEGWRGATDNFNGTDGSIEFLSSLLEAVPAQILRLDSDLSVRYVNRSAPGVAREDVLGRSALDLVTPATAAVAKLAYTRVLESGVSTSFESDSDQGGRLASYRTHVSRVNERDGSHSLCLVIQEITDQRQRERALRESEEKLRAAVDATRVGLFSWNTRTNEVEWDARMQAITGREASRERRLSAQAWFDEVLHPEEHDRFEDILRNPRVLGEGRLDRTVYRITRPDGDERWLLSAATTYSDASGNPERVVGGVIDVTEQRLVEQQLHSAQRMEALGNLTAGVAHNFNNMLAVIQPCLDVLKEVVPPDFSEHVADASLASQRAADIVRDLMTYAGKSTAQRKQQRVVADMARDAVSICRRTFERHVVLELSSDTSAAIRVQPGAFGQVLMNLVINARDALIYARTEAPKIVVEVSEVHEDDRHHVRVRVRDNGPGMEAAVREHIFEPFFTTKEGVGTGLGLATCHSIVARHGGQITCDSQLGAGTTFDVFFPIAAQRAPVTNPPESQSLRGSASVLLIDDEIAIRRIVSRVLRSSGFAIEAVAGPEEAWRTLSRRRDFDLVLLDRSMPGAPGQTLVSSLREALPESAILFFTGEHVDKAEAALADGVVTKPTRPSKLVELITDAVKAKRAELAE